jgi:hypothetical protein
MEIFKFTIILLYLGGIIFSYAAMNNIIFHIAKNKTHRNIITFTYRELGLLSTIMLFIDFLFSWGIVLMCILISSRMNIRLLKFKNWN